MTQDDFLARTEQIPPLDVTDLLPRVKAPTLALHTNALRYPPTHEARATADAITGADFEEVSGEPDADWPGPLVERVRSHLLGDTPSSMHPTLSPREWDVARVLMNGESNEEIADTLGLAPSTVAHHLTAIYRKLGVRRRAEAVAQLHRIPG